MVAKAFLMKMPFQILNSVELFTSLASCDLSHMSKNSLEVVVFWLLPEFEKVKISVFKFLLTFTELFWDLKTHVNLNISIKTPKVASLWGVWKSYACSTTLCWQKYL